MEKVDLFSNIDLVARAKNIKLVAFDIDGVMTDGSLTFDENGVEYKTYNAKDGQGVVLLNHFGFKTAIITARLNGTIEHRAKVLCVTKCFQGQKNKLKALDELCCEFSLKYDEIAYMGDDLPDICVLSKVGLASCPKDAVEEVVAKSHFVSNFNGGRGAVRELCNFILKVNGKTL